MTAPPPFPMFLSPMFLNGPAGRLFAVYYSPETPAKNDGDAVLYIPPFAEEMNRSRRMAALLGRRLADQGIGCLILDLFGTGDSAGDFSEARWEIWRRDVAAAVDWLGATGFNSVTLIGLRLGASLALDTAPDVSLPVSRVMLWQPVPSGQTFLNQFLRIRAAAALDDASSGGRETAKDLRRRLSEGEILEVAGYGLHPEMARAIEELRLADLGLRCPAPIHWFNVSATDENGLPPAATPVLENWSEAGTQASATSVRGESFWAIEETTLAPGLLDATVKMISGEAR